MRYNYQNHSYFCGVQWLESLKTIATRNKRLPA